MAGVRRGGECGLIVDSAGRPAASGGLTYNGGSTAGGDSLTISGISAADTVTQSGSQVTVNNSAAINYTNVNLLGSARRRATRAMAAEPLR